MNKLQDKCRGSLVGGAVGDALGYAVEFDSLHGIHRKYGAPGICDYELTNGVAVFSDDTQMSLFTAVGLLNAKEVGVTSGIDMLPCVKDAYVDWYFTQTRPPLAMSGDWLTHVKNLWACRAPGNTCLSALSDISSVNGKPVVNNSKGCGGVMRVAPIGIYSAAHPRELDMANAGFLAGAAADITHKHPLSTFSSMALTMIVADCISHDEMDREKFRFIVVNRALHIIGMRYENNPELEALKNLIVKAFDLAESGVSDTIAISNLGEGWTAEETLAIAVFSVFRHINDFQNCIVCAVNHDGDSDSTGAVAGNIIGAILGYSAIPHKYLVNLELQPLIMSVADDISGFSPIEQMRERYADHRPYGIADAYLITKG